MRHKVDHFLKLDVDSSIETRRLHLILYGIGITLFVATLSALVITLMAGYTRTPVMIGGGVFVAFLLLMLTWSGYIRWTRVLYPVVTIFFLTIIASFGDGAYDEGMLAYPGVIAMAGLLMNRRGVVIFTLISIGAVMGIGMLHQSGGFPRYEEIFTMTRIIVLVIMIALAGVMIYLVIDYLVSNNLRIRQNEQSLVASNRELQIIRDSLEEKIIERTTRADAARQEAEKARQALELQMWQITGQAKLNEILRGEQAVQPLAQRVIGFFCRYLELPLGAIYFRRQDGLYFAAGFAFTPGEHLPEFFQMGEGLVGQAALQKQMIRLDDIPLGQVRITSGLGQSIPHSLLLLPFLHEENVLGVIELGSLTRITSQQVQFVEHTAESVAIAFHSAQTRERLAELLVETQRQAEELQAQEEELRAANEELIAQAESLRAQHNRVK